MRLGIDIGGTHTIYGLIDNHGGVIASAKRKTHCELALPDFVQAIRTQVDALLLDAGAALSEVTGCGVGVPGTVSQDGKTVLLAPNLRWTNLPFAELLENELQLPVRMVQDSRAAAYGEYRAGAGQGFQTVLCITLGTGIGTGIVMDGEVFNGELFSAGELGHTPVVPNGRPCGCGQRGCLECYAAGKGLTQTAKELWGESGDSEMLFASAAQGDAQANEAIGFAVEELGKTLTGMLNLLSPGCLLFSGGLSQQTDLLLNPLMAFIQAKRYHAPHQAPLHMGLAALGEDAPMIGAALLAPAQPKLTQLLSASVMCADWLHLADDLSQLEAQGMDYLHFDIMDGHFVPNLMIPPAIITQLRKGTNLPFDIHIMAEQPQTILPMLQLRARDIVTVHWEGAVHLQRLLAQIRAAGAQVGIALNPATPVEMIRDVLPDIDLVLLMTVNPGFAGQALVPQCVGKIRRMRGMLDREGFSRVRIEIDGNCTPENIQTFHAAGADMYVLGSSGLFRKDLSLEQATAQIRQVLQGGYPDERT